MVCGGRRPTTRLSPPFTQQLERRREMALRVVVGVPAIRVGLCGVAGLPTRIELKGADA